MDKKKSLLKLFLELNHKTIIISSIFFLIANVIIQYIYICDFFLNPELNGDEVGYIYMVNSINEFNISTFSNLSAQPYIFFCYLFNQIFNDTKFTVRFISVLSAIILFVFLFGYYRKSKFTNFVNGNSFLNNFIVFNILFSSLFILAQHYIGTSDTLSVAFGLPGFILLTEILLNNRKHSVIIVGLLFALSFTSRPTFLVILLAFLISLFLYSSKNIFSRKLFFVGIFFILFTGIINYSSLLNKGEIVLDVKEVPKEAGTTWFERNYLMARKWDAGEIPNTQWLSSEDVVKFKKQNPNFVFPKNHLDLLINDTGLYFRQMIRMMGVSLYSSFRYLLFLFPFLIIFYFIKKKTADLLEVRKVYFTVLFYFISLLIFMAIAFKLMEFRWMYLLIGYFAFYAMQYSNGISNEKRIVLFNMVFLSGICFFILKMLK